MVKVADLFCGAGGTSSGVVDAFRESGLDVDLTAINHWDLAIATHSANHPKARHLCTGVDDVNPLDLYEPGELNLLWASPECTHHSRARGGRPINDQSRATAWCVARWAEALRPEVILVENVPDFLTWGGLNAHGRPLKSKRCRTFQAWISVLRSLGYRVDHRILCAADYGDPTIRKRLFVQAVRGNRKIVWPNPTHSQVQDDLYESFEPWRTARDIIDWSIPGESIFERKRPLAEKTLKRIYAGLFKYGLREFLVPSKSGHFTRSLDKPLPTLTTQSRGEGLVVPYILQFTNNQDAKSIDEPVTTIRGGMHHALIEPWMVEFAGDCEGRSISDPLSTVRAGGNHQGLCEPYVVEWDNQTNGKGVSSCDEPLSTVVTKARHGVAEPFLIEYFGNGKASGIDCPLPTVTTKDRYGLCYPVIEIDGKRYKLDIRFRMLQPHELAKGQGFPSDYIFKGNKSQIVKQIGNAVPCGLARALVLSVWFQTNEIGDLLRVA